MTRTRRTISLVASLVLIVAAFTPATVFAQEQGDPHDYRDIEAIDDRGKILVCKYVDQPGEAERLKDGKNPIEVSWNTLQPNIVSEASEVVVGLEWTDAHVRSEVVALGTTECPAPDGEDPVDPVDPVDAEVQVTLAKDWTGDLEGIDTDALAVTFTIDGTDHTPGHTLTVDPDTELTITETVAGLPEACEYEASGLTHTTAALDAWTGDELEAGVRDETFTVTNVVTCEDEVADQGAIAIEKTALGVGEDNTVVIDEIGGSVEVDYEFVVTNTGDIELTVDTLTDSTIGDLFDAFETEHGSATLAPEDAVTLVATATLTADDFDEEDGTHTNVVTVTTVEGPEAEADETVTLVGVGGDGFEPGIQLEKRALGLEDGTAVIPLGGSVEVDYEFVVTNTGDVKLEITELADDHIGDLLPSFVDQHGSSTLTLEDGPVALVATATLTEADVDTDSTHTNVAWVDTAEGVSDEAVETIDVIVVGDQPPAERPDETDVDREDDRVDDRGDERVVVISQPDDEGAEVLGVAYEADELPRTGDSLIGMALAALLALGLGGALLQAQPVRAGSPSGGDRRR
jgi:hypothetical protein